MPSGKYSKKRKTKPVRRRSRRKTHRKMKGGSDDGETIWTAKKNGGGNSWNVSKGIETGEDKIYMLDDTTLLHLTKAQETLLSEHILGKTSYNSSTTTAAKRSSLSEIVVDDMWDGKNTSHTVPGYTSVVATRTVDGSADGLGKVTLTFKGDESEADHPFDDSAVTFVHLKVNT